jgi:hypothetical protein
MVAWWHRLPARLLEEEEALVALQFTEPLITRGHRWVRGPDSEPRVLVQLALGSGTMDLEIRFPAFYPDGCPSVRPVPYDGPISGHQYTRSGILCLELGPDNWHPHYTAADMVQSAWRLVHHEVWSAVEPDHEIPSRDIVDLAQRVKKADGVLLRTDAFDACLNGLPNQADLEFVWPARNLGRVLPTALPKGQALPELPPALDREQRFAGAFRRLRTGTPATPPTDRKAFLEFVAAFSEAPVPDGALLVLVQWEDASARGFLVLPSKVQILADMPYTAGDGLRTTPDLHAALRGARVAIVGLGSLGSKIAVSLCRSGVRRFVLVDDDVLCAENVCRHEADLADVGALKVDVVAEKLRDVSFAEPEIARWSVNVGAATNPELHAQLIEALATADVIVDATANPEAFGLLAMVASDWRRPMAWGEVFGGGLGGLVGYAHPEHTPCPRCVRAGFQRAASAWPAAPHGVGGTPYGSGDGEIAQATDADVAYVAAAVTGRIHELLRRATSPGAAVTLLGRRRGWVFDAPLQNAAVAVRADDVSCPRCWVPPAAPDADLLVRAEALFTE